MLNQRRREFVIVGVVVALIGFVIISTNIDCVSAQDNRQCIIQESCAKCLSPDRRGACVWCTDPIYDMRRPRCLTMSEVNETGCNEVYTITERPWLIENRPTHDYSVGGDAVQIQPQRVHISLKKLETKTVRMVYRPARNYPLDLYYLMDMTHSMEDDKETLVAVGKDLAATLKNLTENYRVGFGSFVDKPAMPFISTGSRERDNQCVMIGKVCEKPYGFRHSLSLDRNVTHFTTKVKATNTSANLDNLEGGLDALMQVVVCEKEIGWLEQSRKIVVFATDGEMHFAGDGLLAGVTRRNNKECHLTPDGEYLNSLEMDYPSLEEMYYELIRRKVNVIFVATAEVQWLYGQIQGLMQEVSSVGPLKNDSSNILQLVNEGYAGFVRKAHFFDNAPDNIRVQYETRCGGAVLQSEDWTTLEDSAKCNNIEVGKEYEFLIHLTRLDSEVPLNDTRRTVRVEESSISSEFLQIDIDMEDDCPCMSDMTRSVNVESSPNCNWHGVFKCGSCLCDDGWIGMACECDASNYGSSRELEHQCRVKIGGQNTGPICSDRGECSCGECHCNVGFAGPFCECEECPYYKGLECGGFERATCDCGQCRCAPGWSGERCDCPLSDETCIAPTNKTDTLSICSGRGHCECGQCQCADSYFGAFCERSATAGSNALCSFYEPCVRCVINLKRGKECTDQAKLCSAQDVAFIIEYVGELQEPSSGCIVRMSDQDGQICEHRFEYEVESHLDEGRQSNLRVRIDPCEKPLSVGAVGLGIVLATFLLGFIGLMTFKGVTTWKDRREFAQFEKELENTKYEVFTSPLYRSPTRSYEVPRQVRESDGGGGINEFATSDI